LNTLALPVQQRKQRKLILKLVVYTMGMLAFGAAMPQMYDFICSVAGVKTEYNRIDATQAASTEKSTASTRVVSLDFLATSNSGMPWEFKSITKHSDIRIGEINKAVYYVRNKSNETIVGQAVAIVSPAWAGEYLDKIECFCFTEQTLAPGESKEMPVRFMVRKDLPPEVHAMVLSYTFMNTDPDSTQLHGGIRPL
jgi:cytochrome c oxidase assembly protein subunit 11